MKNCPRCRTDQVAPERLTSRPSRQHPSSKLHFFSNAAVCSTDADVPPIAKSSTCSWVASQRRLQNRTTQCGCPRSPVELSGNKPRMFLAETSMDTDTLTVHVVNLAQQKGQVFTETAMMKVLADRQQHLVADRSSDRFNCSEAFLICFGNHT